jgi:hypothetical protein
MCGTLYLLKTSGDLNAGMIRTSGDAFITAAGSILDANGTEFNDAVNAQKAANAAYNTATAAMTTASVLQAYADGIRAHFAPSDAAVTAAQGAYDAMLQNIAILNTQISIETDPAITAALQRQLARAQAALPGLQAAITSALAVQQQMHALYDATWAAAQAEADAAWAAASLLMNDANHAQAAADLLRQAAESTPRTIVTGGNLALAAGSSIGTPNHGLSVSVGGTLTASAPAGISLAGGSSLNISSITTGGNAVLAMMGDIYGNGGKLPVINAAGADLNSLGGDIGTAGVPLITNVPWLSATAQNIHIHNIQPLTLYTLRAFDSADISVTGDITGGGGGVNITANSLNLTGGNIGTAGAPLNLNVNSLSGSGKLVYLNNISETLNLNPFVAKKFTMTAAGNVSGKLKAGSTWISAFGSIGMPGHPLGIYTLGSVRLISIKGAIYWANTLHGHYNKWQARTLQSRYAAVFVVRIPYISGGTAKAIYALMGQRGTGEWELLGLWTGEDTLAMTDAKAREDAEKALGTRILGELKARGLENIDAVFYDGLEGFAQACKAAYPYATPAPCTLLWIQNSGQAIAAEDLQELTADLNKVYEAAVHKDSQQAARDFIAKWGAKYPAIAKQMEDTLKAWLDAYPNTQGMRTAGFKTAGLEQAMAAMTSAAGERDWGGDDMQAVYTVFDAAIPSMP